MADELDSFFAKKATKKVKKNIVQDTDSLAKRLEKAVRHQEQIDRVREEEEERLNKELLHVVENQRRTQQANDEDSEWIELEAEVDIGLTDGLKELEMEEIHEKEKPEVPEIAEKPRTWNPLNSTENQENENTPAIVAMPEVVQKKAYVAPSRRMTSAVNSQPNIQDAEEFPSLMAADDITKKEFETKKQKALQDKEFVEREKEAQQRRQVIMADLAKETQHAQPNPWKTGHQQEKSDAVDQQSAPHVPGPGKYVAPRGALKPAVPTDVVEPPMETIVLAAASVPPPSSDKSKYVPPHLRNK